MSQYCAVSDVLAQFPRFVEGQAGSVSDTQITGWITDASGIIHATFYERGLDVNSLSNPIVGQPTLTTPLLDQASILLELTRAYCTWKLGQVLWNTLTAAEQAMARGCYDRWQKSLESIRLGRYDKLFYLYASTVNIFPVFDGIGGAETPREKRSRPEGNRSFSKDMIF